MQKIIYLIGVLMLLFTLQNCEVNGLEDDTSFIENTATSSQNGIFDISKDNSGNVKITPVANGFAKAIVHFGDGVGTASSAVVMPGASIIHSYPEGNYTVTIEYITVNGSSTTATYPLVVTYVAPENIVIDANLQAHLLTLSATADFANGFLVYFGDVVNEVPTELAVGGNVTHTYAQAGEYTIRVIALSGGVATSESSSLITVYDLFSLPITFENPYQNYNIGGTFGGVGTAIVDNPFKTGLNTSQKVWQYTKPNGAESWSGTWTPMAEPGAQPINIDNGGKIEVMVYATETGKLLNMEIEQATTGIPNQVLKMPITVANQWQTIVFDFGALGTIPAGTQFKQLVFRYNDAAAGEGEVIYIDNIIQKN